MHTAKKEFPVYTARPYSFATEKERLDPTYRKADFSNMKPRADGSRHRVIGHWPNHKVITFQYM